MAFFRNDPTLNDPSFEALPEDERAVIEKFAKWINKWGAAGTVGGIMFFESVKPANFLISQAMVFFEPFAQIIFNPTEYKTFYSALEKRSTMELLIRKIEEYDAENRKQELAYKKWYKIEKKNWKWYQRWLGIFLPKTDPPEWVKNPPDDPEELTKLVEAYKNDPKNFKPGQKH